MNVRHVIWASIVSTTISCQSVKKEYNSFDEYPVREDALTEMEYSPAETKFSLWAPTAEEVRVLLFESGFLFIKSFQPEYSLVNVGLPICK